MADFVTVEVRNCAVMVELSSLMSCVGVIVPNVALESDSIKISDTGSSEGTCSAVVKTSAVAVDMTSDVSSNAPYSVVLNVPVKSTCPFVFGLCVTGPLSTLFNVSFEAL